MKKVFGLIGLVMLIASCGLFFIDGANDQAVSPLALTGGATLSTDEYNEINPFLVRMDTGEVYLFFSSDRNGSYDLFASKMDANGDFNTPVRLPSPINGDTSDEVFPVVKQYFPGFWITYLRVSNNTTNLVGYIVDTYFVTNVGMAPQIIGVSAKGLGYMQDPYGSSLLYLTYGNSAVTQYSEISGSWAYQGATNFSGNILSLNGINVITNSMTGDTVYLYAFGNANHQLAASGNIYFYNGSIYVNSPFDISTSIYKSDFKDISPFIDKEGGFKVYFASDRYGKKKYDLYRYNIYTFNTLPEVKQLFAWDTTGPILDLFYPMNGQTITDTMFTVSVAVSNKTGIELNQGLSVYCSIDDEPFLLMGVDLDWSQSFYTITPGLHRIRVYGMDYFGNYSITNTISFTLVWPS